MSILLLTHQKRASDSTTNGCEPPCGCWELNSGPLEEQTVLLTSEPSHQLGPALCNIAEAILYLVSIFVYKMKINCSIIFTIFYIHNKDSFLL